MSKVYFDFTEDGVHLRSEFNSKKIKNIMKRIYNKFSDNQHGLLEEFDRFHERAWWVTVDTLSEFRDLIHFLNENNLRVDIRTDWLRSNDEDNDVKFFLYIKQLNKVRI